MKIKPDHDELLSEVFSEATTADSFREASLNRAMAAARRHRTVRRAARATFAITAVVVVVAWLGRSPRQPNSSPGRTPMASTAAPAPTVSGTKIRLMGDEELLAMFSDRPVALIGPPERRQFVFLDTPRPRPGEVGGRRKKSKL